MQTFGIEIEMLVPRETALTVAERIASIGLPCVAGRNRSSSSWGVVGDASIFPNQLANHIGLELVSPILTADTLQQVNAVCAELSRLRARVNRTCGLHVHIGARHLSLSAIKHLVVLYANNEAHLDALVPTSRKGDNNTYCISVKNHLQLRPFLRRVSVEDASLSVARGSRYGKLNLAAYAKHGTVEFRHHSGTTDPEKIKNWALLCGKLVEAAERYAQASEAVATSPTQAGASTFWEQGRRRRTIRTLALRPEGVTALEVQQQLGLRTLPLIQAQLSQSSEPYSVIGRRCGLPVYQLGVSSGTVQETRVEVPTASSLEAFLDEIRVTETQRTYWLERAEMLAPA